MNCSDFIVPVQMVLCVSSNNTGSAWQQGASVCPVIANNVNGSYVNTHLSLGPTRKLPSIHMVQYHTLVADGCVGISEYIYRIALLSSVMPISQVTISTL